MILILEYIFISTSFRFFYKLKSKGFCAQAHTTYSNYKHYNTAKGLVGITPAGSISFVSDLYAGRTSDKQATVDCKILQLLKAGDSVMADKGVDIDHDLPAGTTLNIPPFLKGKDYLEPQEEIDTRCIASVRIHVE